jgi:hypothetical protein
VVSSGGNGGGSSSSSSSGIFIMIFLPHIYLLLVVISWAGHSLYSVYYSYIARYFLVVLDALPGTYIFMCACMYVCTYVFLDSYCSGCT